MGMSRSDKKCLDFESPFERVNKNHVLKNPPSPLLDEPIYSPFEFHITQERKKGCGVLHLTIN